MIAETVLNLLNSFVIMFDIVFPNKNESDFVSMAKKLGYSKLICVYQSPPSKEVLNNKFIVPAIICKPAQVQKFRKYLTFVEGSENARAAIERQAFAVFNVEDEYKDSLHYRRSGMNQVLCKLAIQKRTALAFSFSFIRSSKSRHIVMGRIMQNIMLCRKYDVKMLVGSFSSSPYQMRSPEDLVSFFHVLGMHQNEFKASISNSGIM